VLQARGSRLASSLRDLSLKVAVAVGTLAPVLLLWKLAGALILLFVATVLAVALRALNRGVARITPLRGPWALAATMRRMKPNDRA
jgi:hypothetical protein